MLVRSRAAVVLLISIVAAASCGEIGGPTGLEDQVTVETEGLPEGIQGQAYSQQLAADGGSGGYEWELASGSLPAGLTLSSAGLIFGTPTASGVTSFSVRATDAAGATGTAALSIDVVPQLGIVSGTLADGVVGEAYAAELVVAGGRGAYAWSLSAGTGPSWLAVSTGGEVSGTPTAAGPVVFEVAVADESGQEATRELSLTVLAALAIETVTLADATQGRPFAAQLEASGGDGTYAWSLASGTLPVGVELSAIGALEGTPTSAGTSTFTVRVTDGAERTVTRSLSITVAAAPTIQTQTLPPANHDEPYAAQLVATGGTGDYTWSVTSGSLPTGLALSADGAVSGTPTVIGTSTFTVEVADEASVTHDREFTIRVAEVATLESGEPVPDLSGEAEGVRYFMIDVPAGAAQVVVSISGGTGDVDLYVRHGALPAEFAYDCRPLRLGNDETCTFVSPEAGGWYIMLRGFEAYAGVTLVATH